MDKKQGNQNDEDSINLHTKKDRLWSVKYGRKNKKSAYSGIQYYDGKGSNIITQRVKNQYG